MRSIVRLALYGCLSLSLAFAAFRSPAAGWFDDGPTVAQAIVVQEIDTIAVVHVADGGELVYFFDFVQGEWTILDHRWMAWDMTPGRDGRQRFTLFWHDDCDSCWRLMVARRWIETWTDESPQAEQNRRPWHARLLAPGLRQPAAGK